LVAGIAGLALITPAWIMLVHWTAWLPDGARLWLPTYLLWFLGGMLLAVLQAMGARCYAFVALPVAVVSYFIASTPIAGEPTTSPAEVSEAIFKSVFYVVIATLMIAPAALGDHGWYTRMLATRPMVWLGEISYEIFLVHLIVMEIAMVEVMRQPVYTGSGWSLFAVTMLLTIPFAWLLHRLTRVRD
ncbi:MAG: acyltransferase, partial [Mycobacterium sp.]